MSNVKAQNSKELSELPTLESSVDSYHLEDHLGGNGPSIKVLVFGGLDGILSMFATVFGCAGASISPVQTICVSIGSLVASAFSMGYGEYVSEIAERDYMNSELRREQIEVEEKPECEKKEMYDIYTGRYNFSDEDARSLVDIAFRNKEFFLRHMMVEELGIMLTDQEITPVRRGILMFCSFCVLGAIPMLGFIGFYIGESGSRLSKIMGYGTTSFFSLVATMALGYFKGSYMKQNPIQSAMKMTFNGIVVGASSYLMGYLVTLMFPEGEPITP
ncbi:hypothetical protein BgAZ_301490 [Babesia gibsoni]|uniref:Integral membrane protein n=1 Tax=Babesia gibsoni TaxID=33632 RepID=A0AAD8LPQ4_BABGI|nr:hypothetical protein BgAZ_301490 [Babesia gibsoni]